MSKATPKPRNAFYAQSGGVTAVINASAAGVIDAARKHRKHIGKVYAGRDGIGKWALRNGVWRRVFVRIPNAALASQSTAPLLSDEMSWFGRQYHHVARKLLNHTPRPLADQTVSMADSVLGPGVEIEEGATVRDEIRVRTGGEQPCG